MGQKRTWSFHHVPFSMLWESMPLDYKNNWNSIMFSHILNMYTSAIFDKENTSNKFFFTWKNKYMPVSVRATLRKQRNNKYTQNNKADWEVRPVFSWIKNANKGTNETTCTNSHLINLNNNPTILNFFFRENFNLEKLHKKNKNKRGKRIKNKANLAVRSLANVRIKKKFRWASKRWLRKLAKKNKSTFFKRLRRCFKVLKYRLRRKLIISTRRKKITKRARRRLRGIKNIAWRLRLPRKHKKTTRAILWPSSRSSFNWGYQNCKELIYEIV
jgi:hypothetical protein